MLSHFCPSMLLKASMFSLPQLSSAPFIAPESPRSITTRNSHCWESHTLIGGPSSRGRLVVRMRGSDRRSGVDLVEESGGGEADSIFSKEWPAAGFEPTLNRLSKWLVAALFGLVILWKHDAEALWAAMGSVLNAWLSTVLKQALNQERPSPLRSDPGMPSSHAQSIFFAAVFAVVSFTRLNGINVFTVGAGAITLLCGSYLSWLRVSEGLHSVNQVLVGAALGSACSLTWFWLWHSFLLQAFVSSIWVRVSVVVGSTSLCVAFLIYVFQNWLRDV